MILSDKIIPSHHNNWYWDCANDCVNECADDCANDCSEGCSNDCCNKCANDCGDDCANDCGEDCAVDDVLIIAEMIVVMIVLAQKMKMTVPKNFTPKNEYKLTKNLRWLYTKNEDDLTT